MGDILKQHTYLGKNLVGPPCSVGSRGRGCILRPRLSLGLLLLPAPVAVAPPLPAPLPLRAPQLVVGRVLLLLVLLLQAVLDRAEARVVPPRQQRHRSRLGGLWDALMAIVIGRRPRRRGVGGRGVVLEGCKGVAVVVVVDPLVEGG